MADQTTNGALGPPVGMESTVLESGAAMVQDFAPLKGICAHLNALHVYANDTARCVEANHYCSHLSEDVRQCLIYDKAEKNARLIGVEYMITPRIYETLPDDERLLWHSHVFEVKSGMLAMPAPQALPAAVWEAAETKEMEQVITLYGKIFHLWQTDLGHKVPMGHPQLMTSFSNAQQLDEGNGRKLWKERDENFKINSEQKAEKRAYIEEPHVHPDADHAWESAPR